MFVLDYTNSTWQLIENNFGTTIAKPFIEYRHIRKSTGQAEPQFPGHFLFGWVTDQGSNGPVPMLRYSTLVRQTQPPQVSTGLLDAGDFLINQWGRDQPTASPALYSDATIDNVFGLDPLGVAGETGVWFYPHADAAPNRTYTVFSDFRIMEDEICNTLLQTCGTVDVLH